MYMISRWYFHPHNNFLLVHLTLGLALPILLLQNMRIYICSLSGVKSLCLNFWRLRKVRTPPLITTDWILLSKSYLHVREARSHLMWNSWKLTLTWLTPAVSPESESEDLKIFSRYTLRGGTCRAGHPWEKSVWRGGERRLTGQGEHSHRRQSQVSTIHLTAQQLVSPNHFLSVGGFTMLHQPPPLQYDKPLNPHIICNAVNWQLSHFP